MDQDEKKCLTIETSLIPDPAPLRVVICDLSGSPFIARKIYPAVTQSQSKLWVRSLRFIAVKAVHLMLSHFVVPIVEPSSRLVRLRTIAFVACITAGSTILRDSASNNRQKKNHLLK